MNVPEWAAALIAESDRREDEVKRLLPMLAEARRYYFASKKTDADRLQLDAVEAEPAVACVVGRWKSVVTADAARAIGQDRRQDRSPRPVDCHPVCCAARSVHANSGRNRGAWAAAVHVRPRIPVALGSIIYRKETYVPVAACRSKLRSTHPPSRHSAGSSGTADELTVESCVEADLGSSRNGPTVGRLRTIGQTPSP